MLPYGLYAQYISTVNKMDVPRDSASMYSYASNKSYTGQLRQYLDWNQNKARSKVVLDSMVKYHRRLEESGKIEAAAEAGMKVGLMYAESNKVQDAVPYLVNAIKSYEELNKANMIGNALSADGGVVTQGDGIIGQSINLSQDDLVKGIEYLVKGQSIYASNKQMDEAANVDEVLAKAYELSGNYKMAFETQDRCRKYRDSIFTRDNAEKAARIEEKQRELELNALKYEYERKQAMAKSEKEKQQLRYEEELKRNQINYEYAKRQAASEAARKQDALIAKAKQEKKDAAAKSKLQRQQLITYVSLFGVLLLGGFAWYIVRNNKLLSKEKHKSESLLLNILPSEIADELKERGATTAKHFDAVSVLFTDFVAFTKAGERMSSEQLVEELHTCFKAFDEITSRYHIEKIKTIGDAYLAVCGLPLANDKHAENVVQAATEILTFMKERKERLGDQTFEIRIGIHSGDVVAGIVGIKKFAYDIWGDTVNTAARMEQNSQAGKINISEPTYELVKHKFNCSYRGEIEAKNKGMLKMYFVEN